MPTDQPRPGGLPPCSPVLVSHFDYDADGNATRPTPVGVSERTVTHVYFYDGNGRTGPPGPPGDEADPDEPFVVDG